MQRKPIPKATIDEILINQNGRCANAPFRPALNLSHYQCLLWKYQNGIFDDAGYEIDHINEHSILARQGNINVDHISNLQALCPSCHTVKTKIFKKNKCILTSGEIAEGRALMEIDSVNKKRRRS